MQIRAIINCAVNFTKIVNTILIYMRCILIIRSHVKQKREFFFIFENEIEIGYVYIYKISCFNFFWLKILELV